MSLRSKLRSLLHSAAPEQEEEKEPVQAAPEVERPAPPPPVVLDPDLVDLPREHPIFRLHQLTEANAEWLPAPSLRLDPDGVLPPEVVKREKGRVRGSLNKICSDRMKEITRREAAAQRAAQAPPGAKSQEPPPPLDAEAHVFLSSDYLYAWLHIHPPVEPGEAVSEALLHRALADQGVRWGVDTQLLQRLCQAEDRYFTLHLVAVGKPPVNGENGKVVDRFPRSTQQLLEPDENDQVDYASLNLVRSVEKGQEICRLVHPTEGEPGRTVLDQEISAKSGRAVTLPKGKNTHISEDGLSLLSSLDGHLEYSGNSFHVKPVWDVPGNVDFSTGNINFTGDVTIRGDVVSGFTVRAKGSIHVDGSVEAGSTVEAGGDLIVAKGILGDGSTVIRSQRSVFAKYIENSTIFVRESLQTDCIVNGQVYCGGQVVARSGRGGIIGGRIWAAKLVSAMAVGSPSERPTSIILGGRPCVSFERETLQQELQAVAAEREKLKNQLDSPAKSGQMGRLKVRASAAEIKLKQLEASCPEGAPNPADKAPKRSAGRMECGVAYPGVEITFGEQTLRLRHETRQCVAKLVNGEIVVM